MKRSFAILAAMALLLAVGCSKSDDSALSGRLDDLEGRLARLEEQCKQTNTNISSLQTLVSATQGGDYIKGVTPVVKDSKEVGYTITFGKCDPITIYHGAGSATGTMPVIGNRRHDRDPRQDSDQKPRDRFGLRRQPDHYGRYRCLSCPFV